MSAIEFVVPGEPVAKARPRIYRDKRGFTHGVTPEKTVLYENLVKLSYSEQARGFRFGEDAMLSMSVVAYFGIPKSTSKRKRKQMEDGELRPTKKPDADNILKGIADALNGVAYHDDSSVVCATVDKYWASVPRVEVTLTEVEP